MNVAQLDSVLASPQFSDLDRHFARLMHRLAGDTASPGLELAAALVSRARSEGDICLDLARLSGARISDDGAEDGAAFRCPVLGDWLDDLRAASVVGSPGEFKPLILDEHSRLYLQRYWRYEHDLAAAIRVRASESPRELNTELLQAGLGRLFPALPEGEFDLQRHAASVAVQKKFCVISGGPGTGKTRTVVLLLALLLEQAGGKLRIALTAPTGKAAARLQESVRAARDSLDCAPAIKAALPDAASTIHRLLGSVHGLPQFRHDAENPIAADVVVVDEASMVDLALMAKLFAALGPSARIILLGDKDQLASVDAGKVLGDICAAAEGDSSTAALAGCVVHLRKNYRFSADDGIHALSLAVNDGDADAAVALLGSAGAGVACVALPAANRLKVSLEERVLPVLREVFAAGAPAAALGALNRFRILCALRRGPFGVEHVNALVEEILDEAGLIERHGSWYRGRPVMIGENDYDLGLFNGDVGVAWPDADGVLRVWFAGEGGSMRALMPARLPAHETVFAMTDHKSQGSEFEEILLLLPDRESPVLTRELVYTGLTRASRRVELWQREDVFRGAVCRRVERASGLRDALLARES